VKLGCPIVISQHFTLYKYLLLLYYTVRPTSFMNYWILLKLGKLWKACVCSKMNGIVNCIVIILKSTLWTLSTHLYNWKSYKELEVFYTLCTIYYCQHLWKLQLVFNGTYKKWTFTIALERLIIISLELLIWFLACSSPKCKKSLTILQRFSTKW